MFCRYCGKAIPDDANFCTNCGSEVERPVPIPQAVPQQAQPQTIRPLAAPQQAQPQNIPTQAVPQQAQPQTIPTQAAPQQAQPRPIPFDFSRIPVRYRCPNGHVFDSREGQTVCPTCGAPLPAGGYIQLYRMGNMMGMAVGMGVYIDDAPCGHLGNKQSIRISVPFGPHKVHVTHTATRACNDPVFTVTPEYPYAWCKAHFSAGGFRITVEQADPREMPTK